MSKKNVCLVVIDGWGISPTDPILKNVPGTVETSLLHPNLVKFDAISNANTPTMSSLSTRFPIVPLIAHGSHVGLPHGLMGNSEVGHLNIGSGRPVPQDIVRIDNAIIDQVLLSQPALKNAFLNAKNGNGRIHFIGLVSDGGVHSHINHLKALLSEAKKFEIPTAFVHAITDGRDTSPKSASGYLADLNAYLEELSYGSIADVVGRYYAMDRDQRWERTAVAFNLYVRGGAESCSDLHSAINHRYENSETDEFLQPLILKNGIIKSGDTIVFFNYRSDRMRQIVSAFITEPSPLFGIEGCASVPSNLHIISMTNYKEGVFDIPVIFPPIKMDNVLAEWLSKHSMSQCHIAETEKYAHVTFFFNGGREICYENEDRVMVPSPKVATYDLMPEMNSLGVAQKVIDNINCGRYPFIMCNFAPPDMVGHTGKYEATLKAVEATDYAIGLIYEACKAHGYVLCITADHGNAEKMRDEMDRPFTAHTCAPVPFIITDTQIKFKSNRVGALCDVAPTILDLFGLTKPEEMTGSSLLETNK